MLDPHGADLWNIGLCNLLRGAMQGCPTNPSMSNLWTMANWSGQIRETVGNSFDAWPTTNSQLQWSQKKEEQGSIFHLSTTHFMNIIFMDARSPWSWSVKYWALQSPAWGYARLSIKSQHVQPLTISDPGKWKKEVSEDSCEPMMSKHIDLQHVPCEINCWSFFRPSCHLPPIKKWNKAGMVAERRTRLYIPLKHDALHEHDIDGC
jgi:hypothetical protein